MQKVWCCRCGSVLSLRSSFTLSLWTRGPREGWVSDSLESAAAAGLLIYLFTSHRCSGGLGITTMGFKIYIFYFGLFLYIPTDRPPVPLSLPHGAFVDWDFCGGRIQSHSVSGVHLGIPLFACGSDIFIYAEVSSWVWKAKLNPPPWRSNDMNFCSWDYGLNICLLFCRKRDITGWHHTVRCAQRKVLHWFYILTLGWLLTTAWDPGAEVGQSESSELCFHMFVKHYGYFLLHVLILGIW